MVKKDILGEIYSSKGVFNSSVPLKKNRCSDFLNRTNKENKFKG
jgi:hypothetical protein